jgi:EpsI family protein
MSIAGFKGRPIKELGNPFYAGVAQQELIASYTNPAGVTIDVLIGYFPTQNAEQELIDYRYNWLHEGASIIELPAASLSVRMKRTTVETNTGPRTALFFYKVNEKNLIDPKMVKLASLVDAFFHKRTNGAIIIVLFDKVTDKLSAEEQEFLGNLLIETQARL